MFLDFRHRLLGTTDVGDEAVILQKGDSVSRVEIQSQEQKFVGWLSNIAFCAAPSLESARPSAPEDGAPTASTPGDEHTLKLTPATPLAERAATIVAPGNGLQNFNLYNIDTTAFTDGGVLVVEIQIAQNSGTDGSFNLFPSNVPIPRSGLPNGALVGRYDVRRGTTTRLSYRFTSGTTFVLGLEGNWFSPRGASGTVQFRASVRSR